LQGYDYTSPGAYFVTRVTTQRENLFGEIVTGEMRLNTCGKIVTDCWCAIPAHFPHVELGAFVVIPDDVHGIIVIRVVGATHASPQQQQKKPGPLPNSLGVIVGSFKSAVSKRVNEELDSPGVAVWQRNYYEHLIRSGLERRRIEAYILSNPENWEKDDAILSNYKEYI
jgi:putative transposase